MYYSYSILTYSLTIVSCCYTECCVCILQIWIAELDMADIQLQHQKELSRQEEAHHQQKCQLHHQIRDQEDIMRCNEATIGEKEVALQQKDETIQHKDAEIVDLHNQLESRPWILQREEVEITEERIGDGSYGEVRVAVFRGTRVAAKCLHEIIVSRHNRDIFTREMDISSKIYHPNIVQFLGATRVDNPILLYEQWPPVYIRDYKRTNPLHIHRLPQYAVTQPRPCATFISGGQIPSFTKISAALTY